VTTRYRVLVVDCPWQPDDQLADSIRGAATQYETLNVEQLKRFPLPPMYEDSTLFFWRLASMQREALDVIDYWDYDVKSELVWKKLTKTGKRHFGMGRQVRMEHEVCLIATSGRPETLDKSIRSVFEARVGRHSEKPEEFYRLVERLKEGPYCELFARRLRDGWTCLGNEVPQEIHA
jgi:N6-adenosine-specific RNA methylase IME4